MRPSIFITLLLFQTGCSLIPNPDDKLDRFLLDSVPGPMSGTMTLKGGKPALVVETPTIYAPLDNQRIAIKPSPTTIDYIADVEWADRLSALVHESVIQSAQNSGLFEAVGRMNTGIQSQHMLLIDVRKFHKLCCDHKVEVEYFAQLMDTQDRRVLGSRSFTASYDLREDSATDVALSLNACHLRLTRQIIGWAAAGM